MNSYTVTHMHTYMRVFLTHCINISAHRENCCHHGKSNRGIGFPISTEVVWVPFSDMTVAKA